MDRHSIKAPRTDGKFEVPQRHGSVSDVLDYAVGDIMVLHSPCQPVGGHWHGKDTAYLVEASLPR